MKTIIRLILLFVLLDVAPCIAQGGGDEAETRIIQLNNSITIHVKQITQEQYEASKKASEHLRQKPYEVIEDFDQAAKMLNGRLKFTPKEDSSIKIYDICFEDGTKEQIESEDGFQAYYPQLGLLVFTGGHMTDEIFDLRDRNFVEGNPHYHVVSPDGILRINGSHDGQDTLMRFLEKWNPAEKRYEFVNWLFGEEKIYDYENSYIYECCWTSNSTAIYQNFGGERTYYEFEFIVK